MYSGLSSTPIQSRPSRSATTAVVPAPHAVRSSVEGDLLEATVQFLIAGLASKERSSPLAAGAPCQDADRQRRFGPTGLERRAIPRGRVFG